MLDFIAMQGVNRENGYYLGKREGCPCLPRGSLAYVFSGLLIWMQRVKEELREKMRHRSEISSIPRRNGLETFLRLILSKKN